MKQQKSFYPDYLFEILIVTIITIEITLIISLLFPPQLGRQIDFNAMYRPLPEWYFLWIYELIKYFPGKLTFVGAVLIPSVYFLIILLAPFLDRSPHLHLRQRPVTTAIALFMLIMAVTFTIMSYL